MESFVELDEKALKKIKYIVEELIMTEKTYMQDLQDIVMVRKHLHCFSLFSELVSAFSELRDMLSSGKVFSFSLICFPANTKLDINIHAAWSFL